MTAISYTQAAYIGVVLFGPIGMYVGVVALKYAEASTLGPYTLLRLVIGVATGIVIFREMPNLLGVLGTVLILTSCLLAIRKKPAPRPVALAEAF
jgi:drug/metabolite transporter (DMT)-like permease